MEIFFYLKNAWLKCLQFALASRPNAFLFQLGKNLISEYNQILHQELLFWQLKPCQAGFVSSQQTSDNIILIQEIIGSLRKKKGLVGYLALKLDLNKAFDRLEWNFIQDV